MPIVPTSPRKVGLSISFAEIACIELKPVLGSSTCRGQSQGSGGALNSAVALRMRPMLVIC